jgi:midasin
MVKHPALKEKLIHIIGDSWVLSPDYIKHYIQHYKPAVECTAHSFTIGRVSLPLHPASQTGTPKAVKIAHTKHSLRLIEQIAAAVRAREHVLLVGETGTGKTSAIQYVANQLSQQLIVLVLTIVYMCCIDRV